MAYISYDKLWRSELYKNISSKAKVQDINHNQLKLWLNDTDQKDEKITTNFEPFNAEDVIKKFILIQNYLK